MKQELLNLEHQRAHHIFESEKLPIISATPEEMYRIAEVNPKLFGTKYTRWGCHFKCVKCNGYRVLTGGRRSLLEISRIVNEQKYEHRKKCKHPKWEEKWSLHRAEIAHTFVEQTTEQTHTGDNNWTDITGATITSGNFTSGRKYFFLNESMLGVNAIIMIGLKTLHGSTDFAESITQTSSVLSGRYSRQHWFTVWTAVAAEAIKMQFKIIDNSGWVLKTDQQGLLAIEISEDLTEGSDWDFAHDSSSRSLNTTWTDDATLTIQAADHAAGDTYLVMSYGRINEASTAQNVESRLERSGEAASTQPTHSQEGEDSADGRIIETMARTFDLGASDNTFTSQNRNDAGSFGTVDHSSVFAINLEKFVDSEQIYTEADLNTGSTLWADLCQTDSMTPSQTGDVLILGAFVADIQQSSSPGFPARLQIDNVDQPTGRTGITTNNPAWDVTDQHSQILMTVENLDTTSHTWDIDCSCSATGTPHAQSRLLVAFSMELAAVVAPTKTFTMDAILKKTLSKTFTLDSRLVKIFTKTFSLDSMLQKVFTKIFVIDSILKKTLSKTFALDSVLKAKFTKTFTFDSILKKTLTKTFTLDSALQGAQQKMFAIDSIVRNTLSKTFTFDSTLQQRVTRTFTMNARLVRIALTKTFSMDSVLKKTLTKTLTLDSILTTLTTTKLFSIDAILKKTLSKTLTLDSILKKTFSKTFSMDSRLVKTLSKAFTLDSIIKTTFSKTFNADAILQKTLSKTFLLDGCLQQQQTSKTFTLDALLQKKLTKTFFLDGCIIQEKFTKTFTMDTVLVFTGARPGTIAIGTPRGTTAKF